MNDSGDSKSWLDRALFAGFVGGVTFLVFAAGVGFGYYSVIPRQLEHQAKEAKSTLEEARRLDHSEHPPFFYAPAKHRYSGVVTNNEGASPGYTAFASSDAQSVLLMELNGKIVHRWDSKFTELWPDAKHVDAKIDDESALIRRFHIYPNGDIVFHLETSRAPIPGLGIVKMDRNSKVIWKLPLNVHHDMTVGTDGTIYACTNFIRKTPWPSAPHVLPPIVDEEVVLISPDGKLLQTINVVRAISNTPEFAPVLARFSEGGGDVMHNNTIHVLSPEFAEKHPEFEAGQLMLCFRHTDTLLIIDPKTEKVVWMRDGVTWHHGHDPRGLDNGNLLIFDNWIRDPLDERSKRYSRVIEFDPISMKTSWVYGGNDAEFFFSDRRGYLDVMPNGNILVTDSWAGRLFEVTRDKRIVWDFYNPKRWKGDPDLIAIVLGAKRYTADQLPFLQDILTQK